MQIFILSSEDIRIDAQLCSLIAQVVADPTER